jgi:hypothetical protein
MRPLTSARRTPPPAEQPVHLGLRAVAGGLVLRIFVVASSASYTRARRYIAQAVGLVGWVKSSV